MAGLAATVTGENLRNGKWLFCADGWPPEPLDILHLIFPNKGRDIIGHNVCFIPRHLTFAPLYNLLPEQTEFFQPDDFVDASVALFCMCVLVTLGMIIMKYAWERVDQSFAEITPSHKKWYVIANLFKAFFLGCMCLSTRYWIGSYECLVLDEFSGLEMKRTGILYVTTDLVALYMVPKLPMSTILHHVSTTTLIMMVTATNMTLKGWTGLLGVLKMSLLYGIFSSISFCVNAYLGLRVVYPNAKWLPMLVHMSLWPYIFLCAFNWSIHAIWLVNLVLSLDVSVYNVLYLVAIGTMVHDDIVLIKWLWKRSSPMSSAEGNKLTKKNN